MSNLLEKASILTTPTAYDNGKILSVKPAPGLGSELVTNGGFDTDSGWNKQTSNWTIANGYAVCDGLQTSNSSLFQDVAVVNGNSYRIDFTITDSANDLNLILGATTIGQYGSGTHSIYVTKDSNASARIFFQATASNAFQGSLDNVSVKELIDGDFDFTRNSSATRVNAQGLVEDVQILSSNLVSNGDFSQEGSELVTNGSFDSDSGWTLGTGWSIANGNANSDGVSSNSNLVTTSAFYSGSTPVKMTINVTDYVSGGLKVYLSSTNFTEITANGNYTFYTTADRTDGKLYLKSINFIGSIDNVSVKEVGQDWTLSSGASIGENKLDVDAIAFDFFATQNALTNGLNYKVTLDAEVTSGDILLYTGTQFATINSNGSYTFYITSNSSQIRFRSGGSGAVGSITNISVIEITDDTNLPRINYEGFSYQDALGSELIANGDFSNGSTGWTVSNGTITDKYNASMTSYQTGIRILPFSNTGTFKVTFDLVVTSGSCKFDAGGSNNAIYSTSGTKEIIVTDTTKFEFNAFNLGWVGTLDNVSVKEYFGQEVVPDSGVGSWLFEPQSTNLIIQSENLSSVDWTKSLVTVSANDIASPSGEVNASLIQETVYTSSIPSLKTTNNIPISTGKHTLSFYVKNNNGRYLGISFGNNANRIRTTFDFDTETFKTPLFNGITEGEVSYTTIGDYYRILITANFTSSISGLVFIMPIATDTYPFYAFQNSDNRSFYLWGVQVEASSFATSYIPTSGSIVTRLQDAAFGAGSSDLINSTEGVLYAEIAALANGGVGDRCISLGSGSDVTNTVQLLYHNTANRINFRVTKGGSFQVNISDFTFEQTENLKIAVKFKANDFALWINGVERVTDTSGQTFDVGTLQKLQFDSGNRASDFFGKTKCVAVFKEALTDEELTCLTTI